MSYAPSAQLLDVSPDDYYLRFGFSSSMAKLVLARSPLHARAGVAKTPTVAMDRGSVVHRLVLGKGKDFRGLPFDDWRTTTAKAARRDARLKGLVPIKETDLEQARRIAEAVQAQLADRDVLLDGTSEQAIEWHEPTDYAPLLCRGMFDHVWVDRGVILDLKITEDASTARAERTAESLGYAIQAAAYTRALTALRPDLAGRIQFLFAFAEPDPPYALNLLRPSGVFRELGNARWSHAVAIWAECLATNTWPAYGLGVNELTAPPWALEREYI